MNKVIEFIFIRFLINSNLKLFYYTFDLINKNLRRGINMLIMLIKYIDNIDFFFAHFS